MSEKQKQAAHPPETPAPSAHRDRPVPIHVVADSPDEQAIDAEIEMNRLDLEIAGRALFGDDVDDEIDELGHALHTAVLAFPLALHPLRPIIQRITGCSWTTHGSALAAASISAMGIISFRLQRTNRSAFR